MFGLLISWSIVLALCSANDFGPRVIATKGEVWPKPQQQEKTEDYFIVRPHRFRFQGPENIGCPDFLDSAFARYWSLIAISSNLDRRGRFTEVGHRSPTKFRKVDDKFVGYLEVLNVSLTVCANENVLPRFGDDESYNLTVSVNQSTLSATTIWGALRGLETFSQLIYFQDDQLIINATTITDFPRFSHRGLLLDTSRHFQPLYIILQNLDAMAYNKLNVFHWHISDDQSFPYRSRTFPELSDKGAYHPVSRVYEQRDIARVIEYARLRGIRVIPEFDTPGHTSSWGASHPELLTDCYNANGEIFDLGPMNPTKNTTYDFLAKLLAEVVEVFPDTYFHIGGDEVDFRCWESNPYVIDFMTKNNITSFEALESYFIQKVVAILDSLHSNYLVWEEVFVNGVALPQSTVVHVWRSGGESTLNQVTQAGKFALYSSCWYLDYLETGGDWEKFYDCDAQNFPGTEDQKKLVLGGEVCMWAESVNEYNVISRIWPRASAAAEKLWSSADVNDTSKARQRLEEHACRMNHRGVAAQPPNGPGVCL